MGNPYYSELPEQNSTGPQQKQTSAPDMGSNSKKRQRGGWVPQSALGRNNAGWKCSTGKKYGSGGWKMSSNKSDMS